MTNVSSPLFNPNRNEIITLKTKYAVTVTYCTFIMACAIIEMSIAGWLRHQLFRLIEFILNVHINPSSELSNRLYSIKRGFRTILVY